MRKDAEVGGKGRVGEEGRLRENGDRHPCGREPPSTPGQSCLPFALTDSHQSTATEPTLLDPTPTISGTSLSPVQVRTLSCRTRPQSHGWEEAESRHKPRSKPHVLLMEVLLKKTADPLARGVTPSQ